MPEHTLNIYSVNSIPIFRTDNGQSLSSNNPLVNAVNGDAFSWQNPSNVRMTFGAPNATVTFNDADSVLGSLPLSGDRVIDQSLSQSTTINGRTFNPSPSEMLWQSPPAVYVRAEYSFVLRDIDGNSYTMAGVSIVTGYDIAVAGVIFIGGNPPPGTTLYYYQGNNTFNPSPEIPFSVLCFAAGSMIQTADGPVAVEELQLGMQVLTKDSGLQSVRWIGSRRLDRIDLSAAPHLRPIRIAKGALGGGIPERDLLVSPQHRILVRSRIALRMFGTTEILVAAKHLTEVDGIELATDLDEVTYVHFLLDSHQVVFAEGAETETLFTGPEALKSVGAAARAEILSIFPSIDEAARVFEPVRPLVRGKLARRLAGRHARNQQPLLTPHIPQISVTSPSALLSALRLAIE